MTQEPKNIEADEITLKWGTLKGWDVKSDEMKTLLKKYIDLVASISCMAQKDTYEQKQILIDLVSLPDMKIYLDWDGKYVPKNEAIDYLENYGKSAKAKCQ